MNATKRSENAKAYQSDIALTHKMGSSNVQLRADTSHSNFDYQYCLLHGATVWEFTLVVQGPGMKVLLRA